MPEATEKFAGRLRAHFGDHAGVISEQRGQTVMEVSAAHWLEVVRGLRDEFNFEQLTDLCGIDYLGYGDDEWETAEATRTGFSRGVDVHIDSKGAPGRFSWADRPEATRIQNRFAVVVHLLSLKHNRRLRLRCYAPDDELPVLPSLVKIYNGVNWFEREAFDLFGIIFEGHPDLRRLLTDYGFNGHPFRKDFPLIGNVTVRYDDEKKRVVYVPTEIEPRVLVPRVIRQDSRYLGERDGGRA